MPEHILNKMYNAFVIQNFYYCSTVWNDGHKSKLTKLSKLQKKAARVITGASHDERSNEIFRKLDWMSIHKSLSIRENIVTFKALTANSPNYLTEMFNFCSNETYNLRSNFSKKVSHIERQNLGTISRITLDKTSTISHSMLLNLCSSITTEPIKSPWVN